MQTLTIIKTIRWIDSLLDETTKELFFGWGLLRRDTERDKQSGIGETIVACLHDLAMASAKIKENPDAVAVLKAFELESILDRSHMSKLTVSVLSDVSPGEIRLILDEIVPRWTNMVKCTAPLDLLTTPVELKSDSIKDDIISLEIRYSKNRRVSLSDLSKAVALLQKAYETVASLYTKSTENRLEIVKVDSGSAIRIDCKGIGDVAKHLKEFFLEAWYKFRHRRAEEIIANNKATLSTLAVMDRIGALEKQKSISPEQAEIFRRSVLDSTLGLFECGALLIEIPSQETVDNSLLLEKFSPRLLEAPKGKSTSKPMRKRKAAKRSPKKIKRKKKTKITRS